MTTYTFADCLEQSYKVNWRIADVLGDRPFDAARRWLPDALSGAAAATCLEPAERRLLTHVEMASYAHLFGYVEEFIAPKVAQLAMDHGAGDRDAFHALTHFAAEEVKHMTLFRRVARRTDEALGFEAGRIGGAKDTADFVLSKSDPAVLLFTSVLEWLTQRHFVEAWRDDADLDPLTKSIFRAHWLEESQHAKMDHIETVRAFGEADAAERDRAIDETIELILATDGLLQQQSELDLASLETLLGRPLSGNDRDTVYDAVIGAKRATFIEAGVTHPRVADLLDEVTTHSQRTRLAAGVAPLLTTAAA